MHTKSLVECTYTFIHFFRQNSVVLENNHFLFAKSCSESPFFHICDFLLIRKSRIYVSFFRGKSVKKIIILQFFFSVEDPSEDFVRLRDFVDAKNCFSQLSTLANLEAVSGGFTETMTKEANQKLKLCKRQTRRIYEIARLNYAQKAGGLGNLNEAYKDFRVDVKKRLNVPFQV